MRVIGLEVLRPLMTRVEHGACCGVGREGQASEGGVFCGPGVSLLNAARAPGLSQPPRYLTMENQVERV